jgi:hypothetical protein
MASAPIDGQWSAVLAAYDRLITEGHTDLELILSDGAPALTGGYWTISSVGFGSDADAAEQYCRRFGLEPPADCYVSFVAATAS